MIGILVATRNEAYHLLRKMNAVKVAGIFHFRGQFEGRPAAVFLTRAGVASREQVRRFLRLYSFDQVVSTGACASLSAEFRQLQPVFLKSVVTPERQWIQLQPSGYAAVTVPHLVVKDADKSRLRELTSADVLDMESWTVASILREPEFAAIPFRAVRIVDDLPGEEKYLEKEKHLRDLTSHSPAGTLSLRQVFRFGLWDYAAILLRRHRVASAIRNAVQQAIVQQP